MTGNGQSHISASIDPPEAANQQVDIDTAAVASKAPSILQEHLHEVANSGPRAADYNSQAAKPAQPSMGKLGLQPAEEVTPPAQPGNEGKDVLGPKEAVPMVPALSGAPSLQPIPVPTALPTNQLSTDAAIERVDGMLRRLALEHDKESFFQEKVLTSTQGCADYYERIKKPMWFAAIREKVVFPLYLIKFDNELAAMYALGAKYIMLL